MSAENHAERVELSGLTLEISILDHLQVNATVELRQVCQQLAIMQNQPSHQPRPFGLQQVFQAHP